MARRDDFAEVKGQIDIVDWFSKRYPGMKKMGNIYRINPCPIDGKANDAFTIYPKTQTWKCFSCGEAGDVIGFEQRIKNFTSKFEALKSLATEIGYELTQSKAEQKQAASRKEVIAVYADAMIYMHEVLLESERAMRYLQEKRKRDLHTIKGAKYGFADGKLHTHLAKTYSTEVLLKSGLVRKNRNGEIYDLFARGTFVYPVSSNRQIVDFFAKDYFEPVKAKRKDFRIPSDLRLEKVKFYGRDAIFRKEFVLVEGPEDRLSVIQFGDDLPVVAMTGNASYEQWEFLADHCEGSVIYDAFDLDPSGKKYSEKLLDAVAGKAIVMKMLWEDEKADIDDILREAKYPKKVWHDLIAEAQDSVIWNIHRLPEDLKKLAPIRQVLRWEPICKWIAANDEQFVRDTYVEELAQKLGSLTRYRPIVGKKIAAMREEPITNPAYSDGEKGIIEMANRYFRLEEASKKCISEFVIRILRYIESPEGGMLYECNLINSDGIVSKPMMFAASEQVNKKQFKEKCKDAGVGFHFHGSDADISGIWMLEEKRANISSRTVYRQRYGWLEDEKLWLFKNCAVQGKEVYPVDENNLIPVGNIQYKTERVNLGMGAPSLNFDFKISDKFIRDVLMRFWKMMDARDGDDGDPSSYKGFLMMGFVQAVAYLEEILDYDRKFPFLCLWGPSGTGKTESALLMYNMFGFEQIGENWEDETGVGIAMAVNQLGCLPFWNEEFKNVKGHSARQNKKVMMLNNIYNRVGSGKGGLKERQMIDVNGTYIYTGQDRPEEKALLSRSVVLMKDLPSEEGSKAYYELVSIRENLSALFLHILRNKTEKSKKKYITLLKEIKDVIDIRIRERPKDERVSVDARAIYNHCVLAAGWSMYGYREFDLGFINWLADMIVEDVRRKSCEDIVYKLFTDIDVNFSGNNLNGTLRDVMLLDGNTLHLWMAKIYKVWQKETASMAEYLSYDALVNYMIHDNHGYWVGKTRPVLRGRNTEHRQQRCIAINVNKLPENLREVVDCWLPMIRDEA